ncbi:hypothetical protein THAOC_36408, partial [Thalassiosira oceanica]
SLVWAATAASEWSSGAQLAVLACKRSTMYGPTPKSIYVRPVRRRNQDLPKTAKDGNKKNLADYLDELGRMDLVSFYSDFSHSHIFPTLWILVQCYASIRVVEVGCERSFSLSGYISSPLRTNLGVRTYERLAMLANMVQNIYLDPDVVAQEYLRRYNAGSWKKENTLESLKCWNLERILDDEMRQTKSSAEITLEDFVAETEDATNDENEVEIVN